VRWINLGRGTEREDERGVGKRLAQMVDGEFQGASANRHDDVYPESTIFVVEVFDER
jgi:hypothetical protein